jgi:hypothetical protein
MKHVPRLPLSPVQPVVVELAVDAHPEAAFWQHYAGGQVAIPPPTTLRYHSLLLVGYDRRSPGSQFWVALSRQGRVPPARPACLQSGEDWHGPA